MRKGENKTHSSSFQFQGIRSNQMNSVPKCVGKFKNQICGFVGWTEYKPGVLGCLLKLKINTGYLFIHVSHKSYKNTCFNLDFEHLKKIMILAKVGPYLRSDEFLPSKKKRMGEGKTSMEEKEGQLQISLWNPQPRSIPSVSFCFTNSCVDSHSQTLFWFAPICKVHLHFLSLPPLCVFFSPLR